MSNWTKEQYDAYIRSHPRKTHSKLQEQEDYLPKPIDNETGDSKMDEVCRAKYRLSVTFLLSDKRLRDVPGMLETVCDIVCAAGRQLAGIGDRKGVMRVR